MALGKAALRKPVTLLPKRQKAGRVAQDGQGKARTTLHRYYQEKNLVMFKRLPIILMLAYSTPEMRMICAFSKIQSRIVRMKLTVGPKVFPCRGVEVAEVTLRTVRFRPLRFTCDLNIRMDRFSSLKPMRSFHRRGAC